MSMPYHFKMWPQLPCTASAQRHCRGRPRGSAPDYASNQRRQAESTHLRGRGRDQSRASRSKQAVAASGCASLYAARTRPRARNDGDSRNGQTVTAAGSGEVPVPRKPTHARETHCRRLYPLCQARAKRSALFVHGFVYTRTRRRVRSVFKTRRCQTATWGAGVPRFCR